MLEIIALIALTTKIGKTVVKKGYKAWQFKLLTVVFWFGGEFIGLIIGIIVTKGEMLPSYLIAILGAAFGAGISFLIADNLKVRMVSAPMTEITGSNEVKSEELKNANAEIYWKGGFSIIDIEISAFLDNVFVGKGSFTDGFTLKFNVPAGIHGVMLKYGVRKVNSLINVEDDKIYRIVLSYSRAWGTFKMHCNEIVKEFQS